MTYVIVTGKNSVSSEPFLSFDEAYYQARKRYGDEIAAWLDLNLRIEENRRKQTRH